MVPLFSMMTTSTNTKSTLRKNAVLFGNGLIRTLGSPSSIDLLKETVCRGSPVPLPMIPENGPPEAAYQR